jgi:hypothetical protein
MLMFDVDVDEKQADEVKRTWRAKASCTVIDKNLKYNATRIV